jgi:hypothetical protein
VSVATGRKLANSFKVVCCLAYFSNMKMEATRLSETSADFQRIARRYVSEDRSVHNHRCENLTFYKIKN